MRYWLLFRGHASWIILSVLVFSWAWYISNILHGNFLVNELRLIFCCHLFAFQFIKMYPSTKCVTNIYSYHTNTLLFRSSYDNYVFNSWNNVRAFCGDLFSYLELKTYHYIDGWVCCTCCIPTITCTDCWFGKYWLGLSVWRDTMYNAMGYHYYSPLWNCHSSTRVSCLPSSVKYKIAYVP